MRTPLCLRTFAPGAQKCRSLLSEAAADVRRSRCDRAHPRTLCKVPREPWRCRARLLAARRAMRPTLTFGQWAAAVPLAVLHAAVAWRLCFVSYGWPAVLLSPGVAWTLPLLAWLLVARRRGVLAARRRGAPTATPVSPPVWPAVLLPELPMGTAKDR